MLASNSLTPSSRSDTARCVSSISDFEEHFPINSFSGSVQVDKFYLKKEEIFTLTSEQ